MEIYVAISDFTPPVVDGSQNILQFRKGEAFEIFDCHKTDADWWGARALKDSAVGYVPSRYMQFEERRVKKLLPSNYMAQKETSLNRLSDMQSSVVHQVPEDLYNINQMEPEPDYLEDDTDIENNQEIDSLSAPRKLSSTSSEENLILPKKIKNPCLESPTRQALHKELLLNYKRGINVLEKPELNKVLQNRRENQRRYEWDEMKKALNQRTSLEVKLEQRANRLKEVTTIPEKDDHDKPELQTVYTKITQKANGKVN